MEYARNIDGEITLVICPKSTDRVSNFYLLPDSEKSLWGYYPVTRESIEVFTSEEVKETKEIKDNQCLIKSYFIKSEESLFPEPSIEDLRASKVTEVKTKASEIILAKYPEYKQINASLGIYGEEYKVTMVTYINSIRTQVATYETQISTSDLETIQFEIIFI